MAARIRMVNRTTGFTREEMHEAIREKHRLHVECAEEEGRRIRLTRITTARPGRTFVRGYFFPSGDPFWGWFEDIQPGVLHFAT